MPQNITTEHRIARITFVAETNAALWRAVTAGWTDRQTHDEHMLRSALQSRKWQLIGMS